MREKLGTPGGYRDVVYKGVSGMSGTRGVCVVCHTKTMYGNATSIAPEPHHDGQDCATCHQHGRGFSTFTTVLRDFVRRLFAWVGADTAYASPPAWSGKKPTALPPGLQNHSLPAQAWANGLVRFRASVTLVNEPVASSSSTSPIKDDIIYYYHNDHLGMSLFLTDEAGSIVWRREQKPFGETTFERGSVVENLRFPGQYYDAETGLAQNWHRDYSARIGRYVESDPIGLMFDPISRTMNHEYSYTSNNPLVKIDTMGLLEACINGCNFSRYKGCEKLPWPLSWGCKKIRDYGCSGAKCVNRHAIMTHFRG